MGTSSRLATILDSEMLINNGARIYPPGFPLASLRLLPSQPVPTSDLSTQLGKRYLLRYLLPHQVGTLTTGTTRRQHVTPTAYAPEETVSWLALPSPTQPRTYVLLLYPSQLTNVYGPRWVLMGGGIEYILATGFTQSAIKRISPDPSSPPAIWELEVK